MIGLGAVLILLGSGCGLPNSGKQKVETDPPEPRGERPRDEAPRSPRDAGGELFKVDWNGRKRAALVHVPKGLKGKAPAILMFHGGSGAGGKRATVNFVNYMNQGYILVFPNGQTDDRDKPAWALTNGDIREQVDFTTKLLDGLVKKYPIDPDRVYAAGFSIGGQQVFRLACMEPERFAGFAVVAQTMQEDTIRACKPAVKRPMLWITGTDDARNPADGRMADPFESSDRVGIDETLAFWLKQNGCKTKGAERVERPDLPADRTKVIERKYKGCEEPFEFLLVEGGGHSWPGRSKDEEGGNSGRRCTDIDATDEAFAFWKRNAKLGG